MMASVAWCHNPQPMASLAHHGFQPERILHLEYSGDGGDQGNYRRSVCEGQ